MAGSKVYPIIEMENYTVSLRDDSHFSIGTSPYYAHQNALAIDIYQQLTLENYEAFSPVSGKVIKIKKLIAPKPKPKLSNGVSHDFLILIENEIDPKIIFKLLHVNPSIKEGARLEVDDPLGLTLRNGYFAHWSTPHIHLEIRPFTDTTRARGGKSFSILKNSNGKPIPASQSYLDAIPLEIKFICPEFALAILPLNHYFRIGDIYGIKGTFGAHDCIIDGGIPMYKNGVIIRNDFNDIPLNSKIWWGKFNIGVLKEFKREFGLYKFVPMTIKIDGQEIRGLSLFLANFEPLLKIIPYDNSNLEFHEKSSVYLTIKNESPI